MSARGRKSGTESAGKEGSGGGDGEGDGGKDSGLRAQDEDGKGFTFGRKAEGLKGADGVPSGSSPRQRSGPSTVSYRDKLLSPGCTGFLVKHTMEDDIMQGWKEYFNKMNEKETTGAVEESNEEENQTTRRLEGKPGKLMFSAEEYSTWCLPWMNSLIIKEDREYAFQEGPWMIEDHYLTVLRWRPNFNPWKDDFQCIIAAWILLPDIPFEFYNVESLRRIENMVGKMIKIDRSTSVYDKGGFARICVEIDLKKPLLPMYMVFGEERHIVYEGLHQVCFACGKYGHQQQGGKRVAKGASEGDVGFQQSVNTPGEDGDDGRTAGKASGLGGGTTIVIGGDSLKGSPFGKIRILRRDYSRNSLSADMRKGTPGNQTLNVP
ncbi:hypothetical protein K1719_031109 [Acacia pycnantha]|nr:hypothetical protein K1719_031109 [Acacia pycnantha]